MAGLEERFWRSNEKKKEAWDTDLLTADHWVTENTSFLFLLLRSGWHRASLAISGSIWVHRQRSPLFVGITANISQIFILCNSGDTHSYWFLEKLFISPSSNTGAVSILEHFIFIWKLFPRRILLLLLATGKIWEVFFQPILALRITFFVLESKPQNVDFFLKSAQRVEDRSVNAFSVKNSERCEILLYARSY